MIRPRRIRYRGKKYTVLFTVHLNRKRYDVVQDFGNSRSFKAIDRKADGMRVIQRIEGVSKRKRETLLRRLRNNRPSLPAVIDKGHGRIQRPDGTESTDMVVLLYEEGQTLEDKMKGKNGARGGPMRPEAVIGLYRRLVNCVSQIHKEHIVHSDLSPANLVLTRNSARLKPIDYGEALTVERGVRDGPDSGATLDFMAPERVLGDYVPDRRCDQFSVGAIVYYMLTDNAPRWQGRHVFRVQNPTDAMLPPVSRQVKDRGTVPDFLWVRLDALLAKDLAIDPADRSASPKDWLDGVEALYDDWRAYERQEPLTARLISGFARAYVTTSERMRRLFRRGPG